MLITSYNQVAVLSSGSIAAEDVEARVAGLEAEYERSGDIPSRAQKRTRSLEEHLNHVLSSSPRARWIRLLRESGHDFEQDRVTQWTVNEREHRELWRVPASHDRWDVTKEIFHRSGPLLGIPGLFYQYNNGDHHFFQPSSELFTRMLLGGNLLLQDRHPLTLHFLERPTLLDELHDEVADMEWPVFVADPEDPPPLETVHEAPDFPHYLSLWHDFYHSLRHRSWPLELRQNLPLMDQVVVEIAQGEPFIDRVRTHILSGPEPTHVNTYGFYGSVFLAIAKSGLKGHHADEQTPKFLERFRHRLGWRFAGHPHYKDVMSGFSDVLMFWHREETPQRRQFPYWV